MVSLARFFKQAALSALILSAVNTSACLSANNSAGTIDVQLVDATAGNAESKAVLKALQNLLRGIEKRNASDIAACLSPDVVMIDEATHKVLFGRDSVMERVKGSVIGASNKSPVKRIVVDKPFVHVKGDTAMVSFHATKQLADAKNTVLETWCAEIFERKDGRWLVLQFKTNWTPIKPAA